MLPAVMRVLVLVCLLGSVALAVAPRWPEKLPTEVFLDTSRWPIVEAEIMGTAVVPDAQDVRLVLPNDPSRSVMATSVREHVPASYAITFLVQGTPAFLHNDDFGANDHKFDMIEQFERAIDTADLSHKLPAQTEFNIVTYAKGAVVRVPWTPLSSLRGALFGTEAEYAGQTGNDLVAGIDLALTELESSRAEGKLLIVLSDGSDASATPAQWAALKRRRMSNVVQVVALVYKGSAKDAAIGRLTSVLVEARDIEHYLVSDFLTIARLTQFRVHATFDLESLAIDTKKPFELTAEIPGARTEPLLIDFSVASPPASNPTDENTRRDGHSLWPMLLVGGVVILAALAVLRRARA